MVHLLHDCCIFLFNDDDRHRRLIIFCVYILLILENLCVYISAYIDLLDRIVTPQYQFEEHVSLHVVLQTRDISNLKTAVALNTYCSKHNLL